MVRFPWEIWSDLLGKIAAEFHFITITITIPITITITTTITFIIIITIISFAAIHTSIIIAFSRKTSTVSYIHIYNCNISSSGMTSPMSIMALP